MPTTKLQVGQKVFQTFLYPPSGQARVIVESDQPVDVIISTPEVAKQLTSIQAAASFAPNVMIFTQQFRLDHFVTFSEAWKESGWTLTMGHTGSSPEPAALHYEVYPA